MILTRSLQRATVPGSLEGFPGGGKHMNQGGSENRADTHLYTTEHRIIVIPENKSTYQICGRTMSTNSCYNISH